VRVLVLGGTGEARQLADLLQHQGVEFVTSLAGRVARPRLPVGEVRVGGFGGVEGLAAYLAGFDAVVDATHPFAARISANAAAACARTGTPLLRLERPGWSSDRWHWVKDSTEAAALTATLGVRPLLTVGRQGLDQYVGPLASHDVLARVVDPPEIELPSSWRVVEDRGPYDLAGERELLTRHRADVLVTKDSGGTWTRPKVDAADELGVPVVVVRRPASTAGVLVVEDPAEVLGWLRDR